MPYEYSNGDRDRGSGALVGEGLVITAGHCIKNRDDCARIMRRSSGAGRGYSSGEVTGSDDGVAPVKAVNVGSGSIQPGADAALPEMLSSD